MKRQTDYQIHLRYCKDKGLKPVTHSTFHGRKRLGWNRKQQIFTPHQGHGGGKRYNTYTIRDEWREFMEKNRIEMPYITFLGYYKKNNISELLNCKKSKWIYK